MGLSFAVGNPDSAFIQPVADRIRTVLAADYSGLIRLDAEEPEYRSEELPWSGWAVLQEHALRVLPETQVPHLLSMAAWTGCYLPVDVEPEVIEFEAAGLALDVASLPRLIDELQRLGPALGLATDDPSLYALTRAFDDDNEDRWYLLTFAELLRAARVAAGRHQVLWVVK